MNISTLNLNERAWFENNRNPDTMNGPGVDDLISLRYKKEEVLQNDLTMLMELGVQGKIIVQLQSSAYGFFVVYFTHPKTSKEEPVRIMRIGSEQFPGYKGFVGQEPLLKELIGPQISHTKNNLAILAFYGLEQNPAPTHYSY